VEDNYEDDGDSMMNGDDDEPVVVATAKIETPKWTMSEKIINCVTAELLFIKTCQILTLST